MDIGSASCTEEGPPSSPLTRPFIALSLTRPPPEWRQTTKVRGRQARVLGRSVPRDWRNWPLGTRTIRLTYHERPSRRGGTHARPALPAPRSGGRGRDAPAVPDVGDTERGRLPVGATGRTAGHPQADRDRAGRRARRGRVRG